MYKLTRAAPTFEQIHPKIEAALKGKIVVGHAVFNDLKVCSLSLSFCSTLHTG